MDKELQEKYQDYVDALIKQMKVFYELLDRAFSPDIMVAFEGSIDLAISAGVPYEEILDSKEKIDSYFLD